MNVLEYEDFLKSDLINITRSKLYTKPGVYILFRKGHVSNRYTKKDTTGLIYIGVSSNIQRRLINLKNGIKNHNSKTHSINKKIKFYFKENTDLSKYYIRYRYLDSHIDSKKTEKELIKKYFKMYLDLPILNSKM